MPLVPESLTEAEARETLLGDAARTFGWNYIAWVQWPALTEGPKASAKDTGLHHV